MTKYIYFVSFNLAYQDFIGQIKQSSDSTVIELDYKITSEDSFYALINELKDWKFGDRSRLGTITPTTITLLEIRDEIPITNVTSKRWA